MTATGNDKRWQRIQPLLLSQGEYGLIHKPQGDLTAEVIGVVANQRERGLDSDPTLTVYLPYYGAGWSPMQFVVHTAGDPTANVGTVRSMLAEIDPALPIANIQTLDEIVGDSVAGRRFYMLMLAVFAGVAILLAIAGIYGVQSYSVSRRTSEIGVRVAELADGPERAGARLGHRVVQAVDGVAADRERRVAGARRLDAPLELRDAAKRPPVRVPCVLHRSDFSAGRGEVCSCREKLPNLCGFGI